MYNFFKTSFLVISCSIVLGCASTPNNTGGVNDELYQLENQPLTVSNESIISAEENILISETFTARVEDLSDSDRVKLYENQLVLFAYDSNVIREKMHLNLKSQSEVLMNNPNLRVMLEGRTDDRGTKTYNLILGEHRADAVKSHLVSLGVNSDQVLTVSLGENEPLLEFKNNQDKYWELNRSVFFKFID